MNVPLRQGEHYAEGDDGCYVTVQGSRRYANSAERWAYVVYRPGWWPFVSAYRYGSAETAKAAGCRDLTELRAYLASEEAQS